MLSPSHLRIALWALAIGLSALGLVMVASTTATKGAGEGLNYAFITRQGAAFGIGLIAALIVSQIGCRGLRNPWLLGLGTVVVSGMLAIVPWVSPPVNGAFRWLNLGPIKLQPAEFAKILLVVLGAWYLMSVKERVRVHWHGVLMPIIGFGFMALLVYRTKDLGSVVVMGGVLWCLLFFAGARWIYTTIMGICCLPLVFYVAVWSEGYRRDRILAFLDPWNADGPAGYHLRQSFIHIASGGWWGMGLGEGASKQEFLPERHTDFIYAVICEELGLIGGMVTAGGFLALVMVGIAIAQAAKDRHARLIAIGATMLIGLQAFWNMLVVTGAVPTKGLTLPFISYGGTSLVVCFLLIGLLDAVVRNVPETAKERNRGTTRIGAVLVRKESQVLG